MRAAALCLLLLIRGAAEAAPPARLVVVNDVSDPVSLDPQREFDASSDNIVNHIFDGLLRLSPEGEIEPALAVSWKRLDDNTVEFSLREGVKFHNGEPLTAEAVRFSLARQLDPAQPAPNAGLISMILGVEAVDELTVRIKTSQPDGVLLKKLPTFVKILPPKYLRDVGDAAFAERPIGTGPYRFVRWTKGREIELAANTDYWMKGAPRIERLVFRFLPTERQLAALLAGEVDMLTDLSGLDTMKVAADPALKVVKAENFYAASIIFNSRKKPLADVRVRQALTHLIDVRDWVRYGARGNGRALRSFTIPGEFGHDPTIPGHRYDRGAALALLKEAGVRQGLRLRLMVREEINNFGLIYAAHLQKAGIQVDYEVASQEKVFRSVVTPNQKGGGAGWDGDILLTHFVDPTAHVYFPYMIFVHSKGAYSLVSDAEFDELFERMLRTMDLEKQKRLCFELERLVARKFLAVSPLQVIRPFALKKTLRYRPNITGMLDFRTTEWEE